MCAKGICKHISASSSLGCEEAAVLLLVCCKEGDFEGKMLQMIAEKSPPRKGHQSVNKQISEEDAQILLTGVSQRKSPQAAHGSLGTPCAMLREMVNHLLKSVLTALGFPINSSQLM